MRNIRLVLKCREKKLELAWDGQNNLSRIFEIFIFFFSRADFFYFLEKMTHRQRSYPDTLVAQVYPTIIQ